MPSRHGLFLLVLLVAGCGSSPVATEGQALQSFKAEAKRACASLPHRLSRIQQTTPAKSDRIWLEFADAWEATLRRLRELEPPARQRDRFLQMLAHFDNAVRAARAVPSADGELVLAPIAGVIDQGGKGATIAHSLGLLECSAVPPEPTEEQMEQARERIEQAFREQLRKVPRLYQPAHPRRVRPRIETAPRT